MGLLEDVRVRIACKKVVREWVKEIKILRMRIKGDGGTREKRRRGNFNVMSYRCTIHLFFHSSIKKA